MSVRVRLTVKQFAAHLSRLGAGFQPAVVHALQSGALRAVPLLQQATAQAPPASDRGSVGAVNTGFYRTAWSARSRPDGAVIANAAPYAGVIEYGRRAGAKTPPAEAIARWAQRKLGLSEEEARAAAFPIARAIARRGLRERRVLRSVLPDLPGILKEEIERALRELLARPGGAP